MCAMRSTLAACVVLSWSVPVLAQDYQLPVDNSYLNQYINNAYILDPIVDQERTTPKDQRQNEINSQNTILMYSMSQQSRKQNISKFARSLKENDPNNAVNIDRTLGGGKIIDQVDQLMRQMGLRADNVADAYAVWWVVAWEAVNQQDVGSNASIYAAAKQQAANALLKTSQMGSAKDSVKQEMAESLLVQAVLIDGHIQAAKGNPTQQAALAKAVNQGAQKMGLDLTTMDLTEQGFVPRSGKRSDVSDAVEGAVPGEAGSALAANDAEGNAGADAGQSDASKSDTGKLALYGVGGAALLAGVFALGKSFGGKG